MIRVAALTSYSTAPLDVKIHELVKRGITVIDLYCFCPQDLPVICEQTKTEPWPDVLLDVLEPSKAAEKLSQIVRKVGKSLSRQEIDICGFASFLPDISLPDKFSAIEKRRQVTVKVVVRLLEFLAEMRKRGFSCQTFELVGGHTIISADHASKSENPKLRYVNPKDCFEALEASLKDIVTASNKIFTASGSGSKAAPPFLAIELEPGVSKLLNSEKAINKLASVVKRFPNVGLNLDIGHMQIIGINPERFFRSRLVSRIVHVHISDNANSHFADLCVTSYHGSEIFSQWLDALRSHISQDRGMFQGYVSIEMEACGSADEVLRAFRITKKLLRGKSTR